MMLSDSISRLLLREISTNAYGVIELVGFLIVRQWSSDMHNR